MHGCAPGSGGQLGAKNGAYKTGKFTRETKELGKYFRELARTGEVLLARTLDDAGLSRKIPKSLRRRKHIVRARAEVKKAKAAKAKQGEPK